MENSENMEIGYISRDAAGNILIKMDLLHVSLKVFNL